MRRLVSLVAIVALATPACAGTILYATAGSQQRVDGFCVGPDGTLASRATVQHGTGGGEPRRMKVVAFDGGAFQVLYVAELDRIEAYRIGRRGNLDLIGATTPLLHMDPRDFEVDPVRLRLYVPQRGRSRIVAYTLDAEGAPLEIGTPGSGFTSCLQGPLGQGFLNVRIDPAKNLLYVSLDIVPGRIDIHRLGSDGELILRDGSPAPPSTCIKAEGSTERPPVSRPFSQRRKLQKPKDFVIIGEFLYVEERSIHRLTAFRLQPDGTFCDKAIDPDTDVDEDCTGFDPLGNEKCTRKAEKAAAEGKQRQQCPSSKTNDVLQYESLAVAGESILGVNFFKARIDAYRLRPVPQLGDVRANLPLGPTGTSTTDVTMSPVRMTVHGNTVYVAGGELDQVIGYPLNDVGVFTSPEPYTRTHAERGSFPNDVAVAVTEDACQ